MVRLMKVVAEGGSGLAHLPDLSRKLIRVGYLEKRRY
jgi:hypothetical protein